MRRCISLCALMFVVLLVGACATQVHEPYPMEPVVEAPPAQEKVEIVIETSCWPELTLVGMHPKKVEMVRDYFITLGWDAAQIKTVMDGSNNKVKAVVTGYGYVDIPTSNRVLRVGLCETQKAAIRGLVNCHRCP